MSTLYDKLKPYTEPPQRRVQPAGPVIVVPQPQPQEPVQTAVPAEIANKAKTTIETESVSNDFKPIQNTYQIQPFTAQQEAQALKDAENSTAFGLIMAERDRKMQEYQNRLKDNTRAAKGLAWTNLFTNLAKLAGWGNAPVIKEDNTHMFKAFNEVDRMRDLLDQTGDKYSTALTNAKLQYVQNARDTHNARERAIYDAHQKYVDAFNKTGLESRTKTKTKYEYDPNQEQLHDQAMREGEARIRNINARTKVANAQEEKYRKDISGSVNGSEEKPLLNFAHTDGKTYAITESDARIMEAKLRSDFVNKYPTGVVSKNDTYYQTLSKDLGIMEKALEGSGTNKDALKTIIAKYLKASPEEFADILQRSRNIETPNYGGVVTGKKDSTTQIWNKE